VISKPLWYGNQGLADGFHRLIAMKILGIETFKYNYVNKYMGEGDDAFDDI
jgi:hypothetical protein